jgi:hypothetical protein
VSLAFHVVALCVVLPWTFPILAHQEAWLFAGPATLPDDTAEELNEIRFEPLEWENTTPRQVVFDEPTADLADDLLSDLLPTASVSAATPVAIPGALDSDLAGTSAGEAAVGGTSGPIDGPRGGRSGATTFFGTRSRGDRFVFVVDNSSSMKEGRLEAAIAELVRCIDALGPRQSFYVIFVSDQTYPMYYPQPAADLVAATPPNKQRLADWLQKVRLAGGKNRELITAMDKAAALRPHAVFLLWDGRIDDLTVRRDVITHLTRPNQWPFPVHTLGMGAMSAESEQNLAAIAQAQRGLYRRVDVPGPNAR